MSDREKLIELIQGTPDVKVWPDAGGKIADHLIANGVTVQKWIPVAERLPEKHGGTYVCLLKFPEAKEAFPHCLTWHAYGDNGYVNGPHFSDEGLDGLKVTHWMPLPELPKEVSE